MYQCRVLCDSVCPFEQRLTTFLIVFPRVVLAETVTHRLNYDLWGDIGGHLGRTTTEDISKNSASSRAIPVKRMLDMIMNDPYVPRWTANQAGMQGDYITDPGTCEALDTVWLWLRHQAVTVARELAELGAHKQDVNRVVEPFVWVTQIVTSSNWDNYFALRCHRAAAPAFRSIARLMYLARRKSTPVVRRFGKWHLPFVSEDEARDFFWQPTGQLLSPDAMPLPIQRSAARCAWVSYNNHDQQGDDQAVQRTYARLFAEVPVHASPIEHQGTPMPRHATHLDTLQSNLTGWLQARKLVPQERIDTYAPPDAEVDAWEESTWPQATAQD